MRGRSGSTGSRAQFINSALRNSPSIPARYASHLPGDIVLSLAGQGRLHHPRLTQSQLASFLPPAPAVTKLTPKKCGWEAAVV
jgi:hypothetical protein